ncbi:hypothetical protein BJ741DRAFT_637093 [Chytriomyces cf. hyalinus JEL632]|nr:hypothetical protein BJ741DRAFT_637093 [Chytriomyces cf. hyalinus JEL632]
MAKTEVRRVFRMTPIRLTLLMIPCMTFVWMFNRLLPPTRQPVEPKPQLPSKLKTSVNYNSNSDQESECSHYSACTADDLVGTLKRDSILTLIVSPKAPPSNAAKYSNETLFAWYRDQFLYETRASLPGVDFVIASRDCAALLHARSYGLPTYRLGSHTSDVEAATYRHILNAVHSSIGATSPFIGFANGDILFDTSLADTMRGVMQFRESMGQNHVGVFGRRINVDVERSALQPTFTLDQRLLNVQDAVKSNGKLYWTLAVDYFIWNRELTLEFSCFPPFFLGGVEFDNWFTGLMNHYEGVATIDATNSLSAMHINHDTKPRMSHSSLASTFNRQLDKLQDKPSQIFDKSDRRGCG